jgi:hypothetical protein
MCHISENFVIMSHVGGFLSCWDVKDQKLQTTAMIKNLAAGEVSRIIKSPNHEEREVILTSNRGCIFARINDKGYIVEELFEIYHMGKSLHHVGWINFKNYFAVTNKDRKIVWFERAMDDKHQYKTKEMRLIEWTHNYTSLIDESDLENPNRWMIGLSGTKMYLHNFEEHISYILLDCQSWNMRTEIQVVRLEDLSGRFKDDKERFKYKVIYSSFDQDTC